MMLLAAIVLLVAFLALTTLVARVAVVEQETGREVLPAILREADTIRVIFSDAQAGGHLDDLATLEAARGYLVTFTTVGTNCVIAISDAQSEIVLTVTGAC